METRKENNIMTDATKYDNNVAYDYRGKTPEQITLHYIV